MIPAVHTSDSAVCNNKSLMQIKLLSWLFRTFLCVILMGEWCCLNRNLEHSYCTLYPCCWLMLISCSLSLYKARIKAKAIAINTFMPKNGYRPVEVPPYAQHTRYTSYYIPPVYPQQHFPLYNLITPQTWTTPSFIDPALVRINW